MPSFITILDITTITSGIFIGFFAGIILWTKCGDIADEFKDFVQRWRNRNRQHQETSSQVEVVEEPNELEDGESQETLTRIVEIHIEEPSVLTMEKMTHDGMPDLVPTTEADSTGDSGMSQDNINSPGQFQHKTTITVDNGDDDVGKAGDPIWSPNDNPKNMPPPNQKKSDSLLNSFLTISSWNPFADVSLLDGDTDEEDHESSSNNDSTEKQEEEDASPTSEIQVHICKSASCTTCRNPRSNLPRFMSAVKTSTGDAYNLRRTLPQRWWESLAYQNDNDAYKRYVCNALLAIPQKERALTAKKDTEHPFDEESQTTTQ